MRIAIGILAKDEEASIGRTLADLARQTMVSDGQHEVDIIVVPNGCTDATATVAASALTEHFDQSRVATRVEEVEHPGKSRAWNIFVHELASPQADVLIFLDADIRLARTDALADLLTLLDAHPEAAACSGRLMKDIANKPRKSLLDHFSLRVSEQSMDSPSINGSLYAIRGGEARAIWLPVPTPGEDGFLNAMVSTFGFSRPHVPSRVVRVAKTTHFFEATTTTTYLQHERRMIVGTTINRWLFEHFQAQRSSEPMGPVIRTLNEREPGWVDRIVTARVGGRRWVLPPALLTWRLNNLRTVPLSKALARAPFSIAATILNLAPALAANAALRRRGAGSTW